MTCPLRSSTCIGSALGLLLAGTSASAAGSPQRDPPLPGPPVAEERLVVQMGLSATGVATALRVDPVPGDPGTLISLEDDLAMAGVAVLPQLELTLRPGERHFLRLGALTLRRSGDARLSRTLRFDDETYLVNERVESGFDLSSYGITYGYEILRRDAATLALTFGVQVAEVAASALVVGRTQREPEAGVAPVPMVGIEARWWTTPRWSFEARTQVLRVEVDDVSGSWLDLRVAMVRHFNRHLSGGVELRHVAIDIESADAQTPGLMDLAMAGPALFLRAAL